MARCLLDDIDLLGVREALLGRVPARRTRVCDIDQRAQGDGPGTSPVPGAAAPDNPARSARSVQADDHGIRLGDVRAAREYGGVLRHFHAGGAARHRHAVPALCVLRAPHVEFLGGCLSLRRHVADRQQQPRHQGVLSAGDLPLLPSHSWSWDWFALILFLSYIFDSSLRSTCPTITKLLLLCLALMYM